MTQPNPFGLQPPAPILGAVPPSPFAPVPAAVPAPFGQPQPPAPQPGPFSGALTGLGTAPKAVGGSGVNAGGLRDYLLLIVPTSVQPNVPKPGKPGEMQTRVIADTLVIRTNDGRTGPITITCPGQPGEPPRQVAYHLDADGNPDPARPFTHNPAAGQFLAFEGFWWHGGPLAEKLLPCLDPKRPDLTMVAQYVRAVKSQNGFWYNNYEPPNGIQAQNTGDWPEINAVATAWLAQRGQFGS